jgi:hypothetical protein
MSSETPMGAVEIVTDSDSTQNKESASPRNPNVRILERSDNLRYSASDI